MIRCLIVEDDPKHGAKLSSLLKEVGEPVEVLLPVRRNVAEAFAAINELHPELVFLDVELGKETGFDLLNKIDNIDFDVIFTTNHINEYIYQIRLCYMSYLAKPVDLLELKDAIKKFHDRNIDKMGQLQVKTLKRNMQTEGVEDKIIMIDYENALYPIDVSDIIFLFSDNNLVSFVIQPDSKQKHKELFHSKIRTHDITTKNVKHKELLELTTSKKTLTEWENDLAHFQFCRIDNSYLINMKSVVKLAKVTKEIEKKLVGAGGSVILINEITLPVSKRGRENFLKFRA